MLSISEPAISQAKRSAISKLKKDLHIERN